MTTTMTKKELATVAGYTYRRLYDIDQSLPPDGKLFVPCDDGKYNLILFVQRWVKYNVNRETEEAADLDMVKARHEVVKTRKTELEVARMEGNLVDVQDVRKLWGDLANMIMQGLIHIPSKVGPLLLMMDNVEKIAGIIDEAIREVLNTLAEAPVPDYAAEADAQNEAGDEDEDEDEDEDNEEEDEEV